MATRRTWTRRNLLRLLGGGIAAGAAAGLYAWRIEPHWVEVVRRRLPLAGLPPDWEGRTLLQLSDVHVGKRVDDDYLLDTFERATELSPDLVVVTGDLTSHHRRVHRQAEAIYRKLPRGRIGTFAVLGNHDYGPHWAHPPVAAELIEAVATDGLAVLRNERVDLGGFELFGLDDLWAGRFGGEKLLAGRRRGPRAAIALSHNPDTADLPVWREWRGWILSGHTHGGQCRPPFLPPPLLPVRNRRYTAGAFDVGPGRTLYVNRGLGHLTRVRFNVRPEITLFELAPA
jgi:predicted MPP superfamily phosphohydrolase